MRARVSLEHNGVLTVIFRAISFAAALAFALPAAAQVYTIGSGNEAVIDPKPTVPAEAPCVVTLVQKATFGANAVNYSYSPTACPGPWASVVLQMNISLNAGIQFDRSGQLFLGGVPLWFGTTAEPNPQLGPSWNFQKDVTAYSALFTSPQSGFLQIANYQSPVYTSTITATATLLFYKATPKFPAPVTADMVLPLSSTGGMAYLFSPTDTISNTLTLPTNILHASADIYLQGQSGDEFWYTCVPTSLVGELGGCGGGALREGEVTIDGTPAGVSPVYPWIFTGGIDPYLWAPIPGVQTLDFTPFHADLSPFAGVLSNGAPHTIAASVYGDNSYFAATGAILLFLDHGTSVVTGGITKNTLQAAPTVNITNNIVQNPSTGITSGTLITTDTRRFTISGTVNGSAGILVNTLNQTSNFNNTQKIYYGPETEVEDITQSTNVTITSTTTTNGDPTTSSTTTLNYPLVVDITDKIPASGNITQITSINQQYLANLVTSSNGGPSVTSSSTNAITTGDSLVFNEFTGELIGNSNQSESAKYTSSGTNQACFSRTLDAMNSLLTFASTGC